MNFPSQWANSLSSPIEKSSALLGVAEGMLNMKESSAENKQENGQDGSIKPVFFFSVYLFREFLALPFVESKESLIRLKEKRAIRKRKKQAVCLPLERIKSLQSSASPHTVPPRFFAAEPASARRW